MFGERNETRQKNNSRGATSSLARIGGRAPNCYKNRFSKSFGSESVVSALELESRRLRIRWRTTLLIELPVQYQLRFRIACIV